MNKLNILNELRKCVEPTQAGWDVWFHGAYLGTIVKISAGSYAVLRTDKETPLGRRTNFMAAIACYIKQAEEIHQADYKEALESQPVIRSVGVNKEAQKSVWQKIKGWFK